MVEVFFPKVKKNITKANVLMFLTKMMEKFYVSVLLKSVSNLPAKQDTQCKYTISVIIYVT